MNNNKKNSQLKQFYRLSLQERQQTMLEWGVSPNELTQLVNGLDMQQAEQMIENVIGSYNLPLGIATNFLINNRDFLIPIVIEEPSVVAAVSFAAKLVRAGGGFYTSSDNPIMIGQIQLLDIDNTKEVAQKINHHKDTILKKANEVGGSITRRGGGAIDIEVREFSTSAVGPMVVIHLLYDTRDAMGANAINTAVEYIAPYIEEITGGRVHLRILSNLSDKRKAYAKCMIPSSALNREDMQGVEVARAIVEAYVFAEIDPYRATTHNKGIMNGIDAVAIATGNDWRAIEAGAHAFAVRDGHYTSLSTWWQDENGDLHGSLEMPLAVGIVGGATRVHPTAQIALKILGVETAQELAEVMVAVGLAQNLAALRALATDGIQRGHMRMHARQLALAAGATGDQIMRIANQMIEENTIRLERAKQILSQIQEG